MTITHINPDSMLKSPAFSQAIKVDGAQSLIFIGGQNGVDKDGKLVGDDLASQTKKALQNLLTALDAAGGKPENVVKMTIYLVQGQDAQAGFAAAAEVWRQQTTVSVLYVAGMGVPGTLVEIEAIAAL